MAEASALPCIADTKGTLVLNRLNWIRRYDDVDFVNADITRTYAKPVRVVDESITCALRTFFGMAFEQTDQYRQAIKEIEDTTKQFDGWFPRFYRNLSLIWVTKNTEPRPTTIGQADTTQNAGTVPSRWNYSSTEDADESETDTVMDIKYSKSDWKQAFLLWSCFPLQRKSGCQKPVGEHVRRASVSSCRSTLTEPTTPHDSGIADLAQQKPVNQNSTSCASSERTLLHVTQYDQSDPRDTQNITALSPVKSETVLSNWSAYLEPMEQHVVNRGPLKALIVQSIKPRSWVEAFMEQWQEQELKQQPVSGNILEEKASKDVLRYSLTKRWLERYSWVEFQNMDGARQALDEFQHAGDVLDEQLGTEGGMISESVMQVIHRLMYLAHCAMGCNSGDTARCR